jgi:adenine-specific DNA-methyltransferase
MRGQVQMIYIDPPYGIDYDSNFQQRVDSTKNDPDDTGDDVLTIKAFRDTWTLGIHSYLTYLQERLYLCRELLASCGAVFMQIGPENAHLVKVVMDEVFGKDNRIADIHFIKAAGRGSGLVDTLFDQLLFYAKDKQALSSAFNPIYSEKRGAEDDPLYKYVELEDGTELQLTAAQMRGDEPVPSGRRFRLDPLVSEGESEAGPQPFVFKGQTYRPPPGNHWKLTPSGLESLAAKHRLFQFGKQIRYKRYPEDSEWSKVTNLWQDTQKGTFQGERRYVVKTADKVVARCVSMVTKPGDLVLDITCGSGTTAVVAESLGRRWITCDSSRVAINVARTQLMEQLMPSYRTITANFRDGFIYEKGTRLKPSDVAYEKEPETFDLVDRPIIDPGSIRVTGPFEVMTLGRYSVDDWKGAIVSPHDNAIEQAKLQNYIEVICRLYRKNAAIQGATGLVHAISESEKHQIALSVGPVSGRVSGKQINDAVQDALSAGILEIHILGWAFEANVGEVKAQLEKRGKVKVVLQMIRPDTLAEGLKVTQPEMLFSPLALPEIEVNARKNGKETHITVTLKGVAIFDRAKRSTDYKAADSGYISAWYLDEDYDGDCFVDCQMFFDFKKAPNLKAQIGLEVDPTEYSLALESQPFTIRGYKRIAVKVVDVYGNESTVVQEIK